MPTGSDQVDSQQEPEDEDSSTGASPDPPSVIKVPDPPTTIIDRSQDLSEWSLGAAPSLPADRGDSAKEMPPVDADTLAVGSVLYDFQIHQILGQGAFGKVYLALQLSLNRFVALKVARDLGSEGRTMAQLEHSNIVQVYLEQSIAETRTRLLCMQFVAGPSLSGALRGLAERDLAINWSGADFLQVVDGNISGPAMLQVSDVSDRESIRRMDFVEVTCHLTSELAEGLAYAHDRNIVHRDIKPANILISSLGRPLLADFNLAEYVAPDSGDSRMTGGTLAYMAPEQLRAYLKQEGPSESVGPRADVYSLALVLVEMLTGATPIPDPPSEGQTEDSQDSGASQTSDRPSRTDPKQTATRILDYRSTAISLPTPGVLPTDRILPAILQRATSPEPQTRTESARLFAEELQACQRMRSIETTSGFANRLTALANRYPVAAFAILATIPHLLASALNISYNVLRVPDLPVREGVSTVSAASVGSGIFEPFQMIAFWYNLVVWPGCLLIVIRMLRRSLPALRMQSNDSASLETHQRRLLLELPRRLRLIAMLGWLPGLVIFPLGLAWFADAELLPVTTHFVSNLGLSFLIAITYSYLGVIWLTVSVSYPRHWDFPARFTPRTAQRELAECSALLARCRIAAGAVPLMGALMVVFVSPQDGSRYLGFRMLLGSLIILGMAGHQIAMITAAKVQRKIDLYCGRG